MAHSTPHRLIDPVTSPVLTPAELRALGHQLLDMATADMTSITLQHIATAVARIASDDVRRTDNGDTLDLTLSVEFGQRGRATLSLNQCDPESLRDALRYLEHNAREDYGDPAYSPMAMPIVPRTYLPNTAWADVTVDALGDAFGDARLAAVEQLLRPVLDARLHASAFVGVHIRTMLYADSQGMFAVGGETDTELSLTSWAAPDGEAAGSGWAGQAARNWLTLDPAAIGADAVRWATAAARPSALEPGRRLTILGPAAVAQVVRAMGSDFDAEATLAGYTPLSGFHIGDRVIDERLTLRSDPNDPDGGYLPFDERGFALVKMPWIVDGRLANLAYSPSFAASCGVSPANDAPESLRLDVESTAHRMTVDDMIAACPEGIYVTRLANIQVLHARTGVMSGVTAGGCFLVRHGQIDRAVRDFRFVDSPYYFLNRVAAVGTPRRAAFGYAPWHGRWPIAPTIVPPLMVRDFNFVALAEAV